MVSVCIYEDCLHLLTEISQINRICQSMSLGQNVKITHTHIFESAKIYFSYLKHFSYDDCLHLWEICTVV